MITHLLSSVSLSLCLLSPLAAQEAANAIPVTKTDAEAAEAFRAWSAGLDSAPHFPAQMHLDFEMEFDMEMDEAAELEMEFELDADLLLDGKDAFRSWGKGKVEFDAMGAFELDWRFDYNLLSNEEGLRMTFIHNNGLKDAFGFHLPSAFTLSADRMNKFLKGYAQLVEVMFNAYLPEGSEKLTLEDGVLGLLHPVAMSRTLGNYPGLLIVGWGEADGKVILLTKADWDMVKDMMAGEPMPFDIDKLKDQVYTLVMDAETGALLDYSFEMEMPIDVVEEGVHVKGEMEMEMSMRTVPVGEPKPVVFPEDMKVLDCNVPFDKYWPMMEMVLAMSESEMRNMLDGAEAEEDYEF